MTSSIGIALTGLQAASTQVNASARNIANAHTVGSLDDPNDPPYTPVTTQSETLDNGGVLTRLVPKAHPYDPAFDPDSPHANEEDFIGVPHVDIAEEIVKMKLAEITYKANASVIKTTRENFEELSKLF